MRYWINKGNTKTNDKALVARYHSKGQKWNRIARWVNVFGLLTFAGLSALMVPGSLLAKPVLVLNTASSYPITTIDQSGFADMIVGEALSRIGYAMESVQLPAERALLNANSGIDDGDLFRIAGLSKHYPNLIQVPEKILDLEFVVFTKDKAFPMSNWQSLLPYQIAIITGMKIVERNVTGVPNVTRVQNMVQLFNILLNDRVDAIVTSRWSALGYIHQYQITGVQRLGPALVKKGMYAYLHKKHKKLVSKLSESLRSMKDDGSYRRAYQLKLAPLLGN